MPIRLAYDQATNRLGVWGEGQVTLDDFREYGRELSALPLAAGLRAMVDFSDCRFEFTFDDIFTLVAHSKDPVLSLPDIRVAIVVSPGYGYGIARMYEGIAASEEFVVRVFQDESMARLWLYDD